MKGWCDCQYNAVKDNEGLVWLSGWCDRRYTAVKDNEGLVWPSVYCSEGQRRVVVTVGILRWRTTKGWCDCQYTAVKDNEGLVWLSVYCSEGQRRVGVTVSIIQWMTMKGWCSFENRRLAPGKVLVLVMLFWCVDKQYTVHWQWLAWLASLSSKVLLAFLTTDFQNEMSHQFLLTCHSTRNEWSYSNCWLCGYHLMSGFLWKLHSS